METKEFKDLLIEKLESLRPNGKYQTKAKENLIEHYSNSISLERMAEVGTGFLKSDWGSVMRSHAKFLIRQELVEDQFGRMDVTRQAPELNAYVSKKGVRIATPRITTKTQAIKFVATVYGENQIKEKLYGE